MKSHGSVVHPLAVFNSVDHIQFPGSITRTKHMAFREFLGIQRPFERLVVIDQLKLIINSTHQ